MQLIVVSAVIIRAMYPSSGFLLLLDQRYVTRASVTLPPICLCVYPAMMLQTFVRSPSPYHFNLPSIISYK